MSYMSIKLLQKHIHTLQQNSRQPPRITYLEIKEEGVYYKVKSQKDF